MTTKDNAQQDDAVHPAPMPDPDQRIREKKPDEQTHSRLVEEAEKVKK